MSKLGGGSLRSKLTELKLGGALAALPQKSFFLFFVAFRATRNN